MDDDITLNSGSGGDTLAADEIGSRKFQRIKLITGADGTNNGDISLSNPFPVTLRASTGTLFATNSGNVGSNTLRVVLASDQPVISIDDNSGSLTIDGTLDGITGSLTLATNDGVDIGNVDVATVPAPLNVTGGGTQASALRVTIASDSTGVLSVDDNGSSLTVDGTLDGITGSLTLATNDGIDIGNVDVASVPAPLNVTGGGAESTALRVTLANDSTGVLSVDDNGGSLTVDGTLDAITGSVTLATNDGVDIGDVDVASVPAPLNVTGGGTEASALRVTLANDSTGTLTVDGTLDGITGSLTLATNDGVDIGNVDVASVPAPLNVTGGGAESTALRVTIANDSTGVMSIDDNGGAITVDGTLDGITGSVTLATNDGVDIGNVDVASVPAPLNVTGGGAESTALRVTLANDSTGVLSIDDNGGAITIDGTLDAITGSVLLATNDGIDIGNVDVASVPAPLNVTGGGAESTALRVTIANDSTGVVSIDDNGGAITVDGTLDAITGSVTLATNDGVDVGDVDVTSVVPGTGASNLGKADDAAHSPSDVGVMVLGVRSDAGGTLVSTDGDYTPLSVDSSGAVRVTGGGGGTEYTVDVAAPAAPTGSATLMERDDALSNLTEAEGDWIQLRSNLQGALWTAIHGNVTVGTNNLTTIHGQSIATNSGNVGSNTIRVVIASDQPVISIDDNSGSLTIDGTLDGITGSLTLATNDGVDIGDVDVASVPAPLNVTGGGTEASALRVTVTFRGAGTDATSTSPISIPSFVASRTDPVMASKVPSTVMAPPLSSIDRTPVESLAIVTVM